MRPRSSLALVVVALLLAGCASSLPLDRALAISAPPPAIHFGTDTFAFANESRSKNRDKPDLFANWCFVMARGVTQFHRFARFDPSGPKVSSAAYTELVHEVTSRAPWRDPLPARERIVIPGYASLYELSRHEEASVKAGLHGRFWTWIQWTNWRVVFPMPRVQQEGVARETLEELRSGRPVQWLVTNMPKVELNHTVLVYDYRADDRGGVEFVAYDPNDPDAPDVIRFDTTERRFWSTRVHDTSVGPIRTFRMYYGPLL